ncbi:MAG: terminase large subunit [Patescibacteria group bacterium]|nr:terminase large subunit [Patescibacteria group bacterium]
MDWQKDWLRKLFGTLNENGQRQYRESAVYIGRQNGKTETCAAIMLFMLCTSKQINGQFFSVASDREQAALVFRKMQAVIEQNPLLAAKTRIVPTTKTIVYEPTKSFYRALASDSFRQLGLSPTLVIYDEISFQRNGELYDAMLTGQISKDNALMLAISTVGSEKESFGFRFWQRTQAALKEPARDPRFLPVVFAAPSNTTDEQALTDEKVWAAANPSIGVSIKLENLRALAQRARAEPSFLNNFKRYHLNLWQDEDNRWLPQSVWLKNTTEVDPESLKGKTCYCGIDLSRSDDTSAISLVFPRGDGVYDVLCHIAAPADTAARREAAGVPYRLWAAQGWLTLHPGAVIDYERLLTEVQRLASEYRIEEVYIDPFNASFFTQKLNQLGLKVTPFRQGFLSFSEPGKEFERAVLGQKINHGGNPVLSWQLGNVVAVSDPAGNIKPDREKSADKIDAIVATIMALSGALKNQDANTSTVASGGSPFVIEVL